MYFLYNFYPIFICTVFKFCFFSSVLMLFRHRKSLATLFKIIIFSTVLFRIEIDRDFSSAFKYTVHIAWQVNSSTPIFYTPTRNWYIAFFIFNIEFIKLILHLYVICTSISTYISLLNTTYKILFAYDTNIVWALCYKHDFLNITIT